ncbi:MAG TPA: TonB-dependent receptor [Thermoanaerobaculia bacterium]
MSGRRSRIGGRRAPAGRRAVPRLAAGLLAAVAMTAPAVAAEAPPAPGAPEAPEARADAPAATVEERIVVTATATPERLGDTAAAVAVLGEDDLAASAAVTLDQALRRVPGFTLFRRTSSRTANPTIQGASLRGLGGSGAGRALVLADGLPLADPFGGWVAWGRVPRAAVGRVEVLGGGASDLYGSAALAGVVHLLRRETVPGGLVVDLSAGSRETASGSLWASARGRRWGAAAAAEALTSEGHVPVAAAERGPVDVPAGVGSGSAELSVERAPAAGRGPALFLRGGVFDEERDNGTRLQENATTIRHAGAGADWTAGAGSLSLRAWAADHDFTQTFTAVDPDRAGETLVRAQRVPAEALGASARWTGAVGRRHTLVAGAEAGRAEGVSRERLFLGERTLRTAFGGRQREEAVFVEDLVDLGARLSLAAGLRWDRWRNDPAAGGAERRESMLSPRLALRWQARPAWGLTAAAYRSFRAPTLNELYRGFRVGDVVTEPNPGLRAERLTGAEAGAVWTPTPAGGGLRLRGTLFWMRLDDPVANVTLETTPELIRRQRRNLGRTRSRGLELDGEARLGRRWHLAAGYLWSDARVVDFPAEPELEGLRVPQVPEHQGSLGLGWQGGRASAAVQARGSGRQLDDDRNRFPLAGFVVVDLRAGWRLAPGLELYAAAENLFDEEVTVGRTPVRTVGEPRLVRLGFRWQRQGASRGPAPGSPSSRAAAPGALEE